MLTTLSSSPVVTHLSTKEAQARLTSQIRRDTVYSRWYDRKLKLRESCKVYIPHEIELNLILIF